MSLLLVLCTYTYILDNFFLPLFLGRAAACFARQRPVRLIFFLVRSSFLLRTVFPEQMPGAPDYDAGGEELARYL